MDEVLPQPASASPRTGADDPSTPGRYGSRLRRRRLGFWYLGGFGFLALYAAAALWGLPHIEDHLEGQANERLEENGFDTSRLELAMDGRSVEVSGDVTSLGEAQRIDALLTREWGIRDADVTELRVPAAETGTVDVDIAVGDGAIVVSGTVLTVAQHDRLIAAARRAFGAPVTDQLDVVELPAALTGDRARVDALAAALEPLADPAVLSASGSLRGDELSIDALVTEQGAGDAIVEAVSGAGGQTTLTVLEQEVGAVDVVAEVGDGIIRLTGVVVNNEQRNELVGAAEAAVGRANVIDELEVSDRPAALEGSDERVAALAGLLDDLTADPVIEGRATVRSGALTVRATTNGAAATAALTDAIVNVRGAAEVSTEETDAPDDVAALTTELDALNAELAAVTLFETGSDSLTAEAIAILDRAVIALNEYPEPLVTIAGHTDSRGDAGDNLQLSQGRAEAVELYLVFAGIDVDRLTAEGRGETELVVPNEADEDDFAQNRRVAFEVRAP